MNTNTTPTSGAADLPEARLFTKKPVTISATQWFKNGDHPQVRAIAPSDDLFFTGMGGAMLTGREKYGVIGTLESPNHLVTPGDWIITGVAGEHYACKPDIFEATYSPAALAAGQAGEPWYGHKFKEQHRGIWRCECGKTVKETTADWLDMSADELQNLRTETAALCADYDADRAARGVAEAQAEKQQEQLI